MCEYCYDQHFLAEASWAKLSLYFLHWEEVYKCQSKLSPRVYNRKGERVSYSTMVQCNSCWGRVMTFIMIFMHVKFHTLYIMYTCSATTSQMPHTYDYKGHNPASTAVTLYHSEVGYSPSLSLAVTQILFPIYRNGLVETILKLMAMLLLLWESLWMWWSIMLVGQTLF